MNAGPFPFLSFLIPSSPLNGFRGFGASANADVDAFALEPVAPAADLALDGLFDELDPPPFAPPPGLCRFDRADCFAEVGRFFPGMSET